VLPNEVSLLLRIAGHVEQHLAIESGGAFRFCVTVNGFVHAFPASNAFPGLRIPAQLPFRTVANTVSIPTNGTLTAKPRWRSGPP